MDPYVEAREHDFNDYIASLKRTIYGLDDPIWPLISVKGRYSDRKLSAFIRELARPSDEEDAWYITAYERDYLYVLLRVLTTEYVPDQKDSWLVNAQVFDLEPVCSPGKLSRVSFGDIISHAEDETILQLAGVYYSKILGDDADVDIVSFVKNLDCLTWYHLHEDSIMLSEYEAIQDAAREDAALFPINNTSAPDHSEKEPAPSPAHTDHEDHAEGTAHTLVNFPNEKEFISHFVSFCHEFMKRTSWSSDNNDLSLFRDSFVYDGMGRKIKKIVLQYQKDHGATLFGDRASMIDINSSLIRATRHAERYMKGAGHE